MIIPKYLQRPDMTEERKRRLIAWIETKREKMREVPVFEEETEAVKAAVSDHRQKKTMMPTVWKEPEDIGQRYAVVPMELREAAQISGYTETADGQKIYDLAKREEDETDKA